MKTFARQLPGDFKPDPFVRARHERDAWLFCHFTASRTPMRKAKACAMLPKHYPGSTARGIVRVTARRRRDVKFPSWTAASEGQAVSDCNFTEGGAMIGNRP
jgi:hypothetical protein